MAVAEHKVDDLCGGGQCPGAGIQQVERRDRVEVGKNRVDPRDAEYAGPQDHDDRRPHGLAQPAGGGNRAVHERRGAVGPAHDHNALHARVDDGALGRKQRQKLPSKDEQPAAQHRAQAERVGQRDEVAFLDAVQLARAVVLAHKAGAGHVKRRHSVINHRVGVGRGGVALDHQRVEGVDARLNKEVGNRKDRILQARGHAQHQDALCHAKVQPDLAEIQRVAVADLCQRVQDQPCRDALGNRAGQRDAGDIELADDDEKQVEQDVQHARKRQVGQRLFGLTDGAEHCVAEVVECQRRHTEKVDPQVQNRTGQQVLLGVQQFQQRRRTKQTDEQQQHTGGQADQQRRMDGLADVLGVPGTVKAGDQHIDAVAQADQKAGEQCHKRRRRSHGAERRGTGKPAHNGNVGHVEQNL